MWHFTGALLPPLGWLDVGWLCVPLLLSLLLVGMHAPFGSPLFFNGETKIILGGCWIMRTGIGETGGILDGEVVKKVVEVSLTYPLYSGVLPEGPP